MRVQVFNPIVLLLIAIFTASFIYMSDVADAAPEVQVGTNPITYGWIGRAQLSDLSPTRIRNPYDLLRQRHLKEAALGLQQELAQHPDSLAAYVGLMQAEPARWPTEISRLRAEIAQKRTNHQEPQVADLFKLGVLLYYRWGQQPTPPRDQKPLAEAQTLLVQAWHRDHQPIIGLALGDTLIDGILSSDSLTKGLSRQTISLQLLKELGGPQVYAQYLRAEKSLWNADPPAVSLVPKQNLRPLLAVVANLRSLYGQRSGILRVVNGKPTMIDNPVPASQIAHERYLREWFNRLVAAIPAP